MHPFVQIPLLGELPAWGLIITTTMLVCGYIGHRMAVREGLPRDIAMDVVLIILGGHLIGGRLGYVRSNLHKFEGNWGKVFDLSSGGSDFMGAFLLILVLLGWYLWRKRLNLWQVADIAAPLCALGQGIGRHACLMAGCCYGKPTDLPWAITFTHPRSRAPLHVGLHPTQLYEVAYGLAIAALLFWMRRRRTHFGVVAHTYLILFSISRFTLEVFRGDHKRGFVFEQRWGEALSVPQAVAIGLCLWGIVGVVLCRRSERLRLPTALA